MSSAQPTLWASIVAGRDRSASVTPAAAAKPIPGTTMMLAPHPTTPGHGHAKRSFSLSGASYPSVLEASRRTPVEGTNSEDQDATATGRVKFFLDNTSSVGSRTSSESGYSEHRPNNSSSYAAAAMKPASVGADCGGAGEARNVDAVSKLPDGDRDAKREEKHNDKRDFDRTSCRQVGRSVARGNYNHRGKDENYEHRGGSYGNRGNNYGSRRGNYSSRGSMNSSGRGGNYSRQGYYRGDQDHGRGRRGVYNHDSQQYNRQGSRQSKSEPYMSSQTENRSLRRAVSDKPEGDHY